MRTDLARQQTVDIPSSASTDVPVESAEYSGAPFMVAMHFIFLEKAPDLEREACLPPEPPKRTTLATEKYSGLVLRRGHRR